MTVLYYDECCELHHPSASHPESPARTRRAWQSLMESGVADHCDRGEYSPAQRDQILAVHAESQVTLAEETSARGGYIEADTPVDGHSFDAATRAAGMALAAVDRVLSGDDENAFCLIRPPGHHATQTQSMGFCLFNNIAIAARHAIDRHGVDRILIVDWDVHHGNGTQDIFYDDPRVMFFSMHRHPFYPGTGLTGETGTGKGLGTTRNLPIAVETPTELILDQFEQALHESASRSKPQLVLISAGFDAHHRDPIGGLRIGNEHFVRLSQLVSAVANEYAQGKTVSLLEGGYNVDVLSQCVVDHVRCLLGDSP